ncbi:hypothetical protein, partial [Altererythrobacter sp.]|uniref:hypothetical protein n=1 Tax=Altererythrobacter sp. TaxID=1872480 RepID=UPI003D0782D9
MTSRRWRARAGVLWLAFALTACSSSSSGDTSSGSMDTVAIGRLPAPLIDPSATIPVPPAPT